MFRAFFDENNPIMKGLSVAADLIVGNLLALACALPLVTAGASYAALCTLCRKLVRNEEGYLLRDYLRAFRSNLKGGSLLGTAFLLCSLVLYVDYRLAAWVLPILRVGVTAVWFCLLSLALYAFPLLARYEQSLWTTVKNAAALAVAYFPRTAGMVFCTAGFWVVALSAPVLTALLPLFGLSLPCYVCALLCDPILDRLEGKDGKTGGNADSHADTLDSKE